MPARPGPDNGYLLHHPSGPNLSAIYKTITLNQRAQFRGHNLSELADIRLRKHRPMTARAGPDLHAAFIPRRHSCPQPLRHALGKTSLEQDRTAGNWCRTVPEHRADIGVE